MERTDPTLADDVTVAVNPQATQLFPHRTLDDDERRVTEADRRVHRTDAQQQEHEELSQIQAEKELPRREPPAPDEVDKCDVCGCSHDRGIGQVVRNRGTALLTNEFEDEYLCPTCYAQYVASYLDWDSGLALTLIALDERAPQWKIAIHYDRDESRLREEITEITDRYLRAKSTVETDSDPTTEQQRLIELFPDLRITIDHNDLIDDNPLGQYL